ncbi:GspH/FimT family protein [Alcanivorax sp. DP30]|uniref:GspH/FimT family pseudopilin n=1 Tax=Alcanivorax sp. DP30 TaxID=2606217 RepID=UPI00136D57C5|nr:GspH/FimT family protein [Alcanivorax sp. DP30]MZR61357.1 prepilin-type N-terminal cleavage/methylation domain-containing protein [Alcanivorax sp. DP30]
MSKPRYPRRQAGFTIIELIVSVLIIAIGAAIAVPAFNEMQASGAIRATASDFISSVNAARLQAVSLRTTVTLKPVSGSNWGAGWMIEYPASVTTEKNQTFLPQGSGEIKSEDGLSEIQFRSNGLTNVGEAVFTLCDDRSGEKGRTITISPFGKVTNEVKSCS